MLDANNRVQSRVLLPASARLGVTLWPCLYGSSLPCISEDYRYSSHVQYLMVGNRDTLHNPT
jgi:hypothetical protein